MKEYICPECLNVGQPKKMKRGSRNMEIFLWMMFPLGVFYSVWRSFAKYEACKQCSREGLIDTNTNFGKVLVMRYEREVLGIDPKDNPNIEKYLNSVTKKNNDDEKSAISEDFIKKAPPAKVEIKAQEELSEIMADKQATVIEENKQHAWPEREKKNPTITSANQDDW